jgi:hypothetical protein
MATESQKRKAAAQTGAYLVIITAIVVVANLLSAGIYSRVDTTKNDRFTLSDGSGRLIRSLKEPVQVDVYVKTGLAQLDTFVRDLKHLLQEYERAGQGKFKYTIIEPDTDEWRMFNRCDCARVSAVRIIPRSGVSCLRVLERVIRRVGHVALVALLQILANARPQQTA